VAINEDLRRRAETLTRLWDGIWDHEKQHGRKATCPINGCGEALSITPKAGIGLALICNGCRAGDRGDDSLLTAARMEGIDCGPGNGKRPEGHRVWPAPSDSITGLKRAERRVLKYAAAQTSTGAWFDLPRRTTVAACHISDRDFIKLLERLEARGLIRVRSNEYALKRPTRIEFKVDPVDLARRLFDGVNIAPENGTTPSENGTAMERTSKMVPPPLENGTTMERLPLRIRDNTCHRSVIGTEIVTIEDALGAGSERTSETPQHGRQGGEPPIAHNGHRSQRAPVPYSAHCDLSGRDGYRKSSRDEEL